MFLQLTYVGADDELGWFSMMSRCVNFPCDTFVDNICCVNLDIPIALGGRPRRGFASDWLELLKINKLTQTI